MPKRLRGPVIGCITPKAARGGPIAPVADGNGIVVGLEARRLDLDVPAGELHRQLGVYVPAPSKVSRGDLKFHAEHVAPASEGAVVLRL